MCVLINLSISVCSEDLEIGVSKLLPDALGGSSPGSVFFFSRS